MSEKHRQKDTEVIPVSAARFMSWLAIVMSVGFSLLLYFIFIKDMLTGIVAWLALDVMLGMSVFSIIAALRSLRQKMRCPQCGQPFFAHVKQMFLPARNCAACRYHCQTDSVIER